MQSFLKVKSDKPLATGTGPYLNSCQSTSKILWNILAALTPIMIGSFIFSGWNAFRIYSLAISSGLLFEYLFELGTGQKSRIHDGSTILVSVLFSFLMPPEVPFQLIVLGIFIAVIVGKEVFGGLGQNLFHPVLIGYASVLILFPREMVFVQPAQLNWKNLLISQPELLGTGIPFLILICGAFLILKQLIRFESVFFYLILSFLGFYLMRLNIHFLGFSGFVFLMAFFFVTDPASGPITQEGRIVFSAAAGLMTAAFCSWMNIGQAAASAILLSSAAVPLMDYFIRPVLHKT